MNFQAFSVLPMIFQAENNECGLACLAMVCSYHGHTSDLQSLRSKFGPVALGSSVKHLMDLASRLDLRGRALKFELNDLRNLKLPAIVHWDMDHFVVIKKLGRSSVTVHDPASGIQQYSMKELGYHLTGIALEFSPTANFKKSRNLSSIKLSRLFQGVDLTRTSLAHLFVMTLAIQLLALLNPLYLQLVIDQGLVKGDTEFILLLGLMFIVVVLLKSSITHLRGMYLLQFGNRIGFQLLGNSAHHLLSLPMDFFSRREMGDIVSRFGSLEKIRKLVTQELVTIVVDGIFSIATLLMLFLYSPMLTGIVVGVVLLVTVVRFACIGYERNLRKSALITSAKQQTRFMENIRSIRTSKINNIELDRLAEWENDLVNQLNSTYRLESFQIRLSTFQTIVLGTENILVIYLGATTVVAGELTLGQLMSFVFLKQHFSSSVFAMLPKLSELKMLNLELERIGDLLNSPMESRQNENYILPSSAAGTIEFVDLSVFYPGREAPVFRPINFTIEPGTCVAISGASGSGKSTLVKALLKLESQYDGQIVIGGQNLEHISRQSFRDQVSAILHDDCLLAGDLAYNIHLGIDPSNYEKLQCICDELEITEIVNALPLGFCTEIGELGSILSAGQVQRILLARALYRSPKLLVLDEALSHLNPDAAQSILLSLKAKGITIILVSHDKHLVSLADSVLTLDHYQAYPNDS